MTDRTPKIGLDALGVGAETAIHWNLLTAPLVEHAVQRGEGRLAKDGPLVVETGKHTGRSAKDKFIVRDAETEDNVWWGSTNVGMTPEHFAALNHWLELGLIGAVRTTMQQVSVVSQK